MLEGIGPKSRSLGPPDSFVGTKAAWWSPCSAALGMRIGELCKLAAGAVVVIGQAHWLRVPLGKVRNDRFIPLHPESVSPLEVWTADNIEHIRHYKLLLADQDGPLDRHRGARILNRVARHAGIGRVESRPAAPHPGHPRPLTGGMRLEAIATLLGHRSMEPKRPRRRLRSALQPSRGRTLGHRLPVYDG